MATLPDGTEVPESTLAEILAKGKLLDALHDDPQYRGQLLGLVKQKFPQARIPEIDTPLTIEKEIAAPIRKDVEEIKAQLTQDRLERQADAERRAMVGRGVIEEADIPEVEKLMADKGIGKFETAAEHFAMGKKIQPPRPTPTPFQTPNFKEFFKDPVGTARKEAYKVISELPQR